MTLYAHLLWLLRLTRAGNHVARSSEARHRRDWGGRAWTGR